MLREWQPWQISDTDLIWSLYWFIRIPLKTSDSSLTEKIRILFKSFIYSISLFKTSLVLIILVIIVYTIGNIKEKSHMTVLSLSSLTFLTFLTWGRTWVRVPSMPTFFGIVIDLIFSAWFYQQLDSFSKYAIYEQVWNCE